MTSAFFFNKLKPSLYVVPRLGIKISPEEQLQRLRTPWQFLKVFSDGPASRLPDHYKKFYWQWQHGEKSPVHYEPEIGNFKLSPDKKVVPINHEDSKVQVVYPEECNQGLWGGEGFIKGYYHIGRYKGENAHYWSPNIRQSVLYSEILDKYMEMTVTKRCLRLIDTHFGLDSYLFETSYADINSRLGFRLKREMLLSLIRQTLYPHNMDERLRVTNKYNKHVIPEEEAEWLGLSLLEAVERQEQLEEVQPEPLKHVFRQQLIEYLHANPPQDDGDAPIVPGTTQPLSEPSWLKRNNPFRRSA